MKATKEEIINLYIGMREILSSNYLKLIRAYLKKNDMDLDKTKYYYDNFTEEQFIDKLKEFYVFRGKVTFESLAKAKLKTNEQIPLESQEQKNFVKWLREQNKLRPKDKKWKFSSSGNGFYLGSSNNAKYITSLKAQGLDTGELDLKISPGKGLTIYVEMKRVKGSKVSPEQIEYVEWYNSNGYPAKICYGCQDAIGFIEEIKIKYNLS